MLRYSFLLTLILSCLSLFIFADNKQNEKISEFIEENAECLKCHSHSTFEYYNEYSMKTEKQPLCLHYFIDSSLYYQSNHWSFSCYDCHSYDDASYPHAPEGRLEEMWNCIDCHGYDDNYAHYHFEDIEIEFQQSIHFEVNEENFNCWKCHNPHTYKIKARTTKNILQTIAYDNDICLSCHADFDRFQLLTNQEGIDIIEYHDWLPNQKLHFKNVRCIECHTQINDTILIAHLILPKEQAVRKCTECHSKNSRLMSTLYKFQSKENRTKAGFLNATILNKSYVIGANRNYILNRISVAIFIITLILISFHIILRIIFKKN